LEGKQGQQACAISRSLYSSDARARFANYRCCKPLLATVIRQLSLLTGMLMAQLPSPMPEYWNHPIHQVGPTQIWLALPVRSLLTPTPPGSRLPFTAHARNPFYSVGTTKIWASGWTILHVINRYLSGCSEPSGHRTLVRLPCSSHKSPLPSIE